MGRACACSGASGWVEQVGSRAGGRGGRVRVSVQPGGRPPSRGVDREATPEQQRARPLERIVDGVERHALCRRVVRHDKLDRRLQFRGLRHLRLRHRRLLRRRCRRRLVHVVR
eukprot:264778-Prymnesium_polylepis.1